MPIELFDCTAMSDEEIKKKFLKDGDMTPNDLWGSEFKIILTSTFSKEDVFDFLSDSIPLNKLKIINVVSG